MAARLGLAEQAILSALLSGGGELERRKLLLSSDDRCAMVSCSMACGTTGLGWACGGFGRCSSTCGELDDTLQHQDEARVGDAGALLQGRCTYGVISQNVSFDQVLDDGRYRRTKITEAASIPTRIRGDLPFHHTFAHYHEILSQNRLERTLSSAAPLPVPRRPATTTQSPTLPTSASRRRLFSVNGLRHDLDILPQRNDG